MWEGMKDKMTQGYAMCVLDYDYMILDNAFLVHKPGIKIFQHDVDRDAETIKNDQLIKELILPELELIYGKRDGCYV